MGLVKFGDFVKEVKINIDRNNNPYEYYVAGDHMDSEDLTIRRKGTFATDDVGPAFTRLFKPGQILYGSRRTYLKKVAVADFEGICSNTTFVLETKDESKLRQRLLPFIMLTDDFTKWSISKSKGSTNPYILFSDLANYEFELPDISRQDELVELLWQAYETKESYKEMIRATDEMVKSQFIEMFGESFSSNATIPLSEMVQDSRPITYGVIKPGDFVEDGVVLVRVKDIVDGIILLADLRKITSTVAQNYVRSTLSPGDILLSIRGTIGRTAIVPKELDGANITQDTARISLREEFNNHFIKCVLDSPVIQSWIQLHVKGLAVKGINLEDVRRIPIPSVKNELQEIYIALYHQADKSKFELKQAIERIDKVMRALMQ